MAIAMAKLNLIQYDPLTGLLRPEPFFEKVLQKINGLSKRRREEGAMALVMGDVDWFKAYNDRNGQEAGNRLLRELGHVLKLAIREEDLICRYGGEEFLFFLTGRQGRRGSVPADGPHPQERRGPLLRAAGIPAPRQPDHVLRRDGVPEELR
ncbi:MAG: GGDEF domain-containing protein [Ignavibacteriales bacterium]|nr:GGDEF domain-containing protein [Ignavibacteriales bacterium]